MTPLSGVARQMIPRRYIHAVDQAVENTPPERNRVVDTWRASALLIVVFGHWLAASVWIQDDGSVSVMNTLEWIPYAGWFTWLVQVMPVFFFVGGYANASALESSTSNRRSWITNRFRRLFAPAVPVIVVWTILSFGLRPFIEADVLYAGVLNATIPLWFLAVYLILIAVAPASYALWKRWGMASVGALALGAILVDILHLHFGIAGVAWLNLVFVWGAIHQLGYWWYSRKMSDRDLPHKSAISISLVALGTLIAVTWAGWYPVSMLDIPGAGPDNATPATSAILLLGLVQIGVILSTAPSVERFAHRPKVWRRVVGLSGLMMTIYVWHLTALSLVIAAGMLLFNGAALSVEPGVPMWWLTRVLFFAALIAVTAALHVPFARFEVDIRPHRHNTPMPAVVVSLTAAIVTLGATSFLYLIDEQGNITWWIAILAIITATLMEAYPSSWKSHRDTPELDSALG